MKSAKLWCVVAALCLAVEITQAASKTWTGTVSSDWSNGGNWSPAGVPGLGDAVFISSGSVLATDAVTVASVSLSGGTCTFNAPASLGVLTLSGNATLGGTNVVTVTNLTWTGGYMTGVGQTVVPPGGSLWLDGTAAKYLSQRVLSNQGTAVWTNTGGLYGYYGAVVNNSGAWDTRSDATFLYYGGGSYPPVPVFNNSGSFTKTGGGGSTIFSGAVFNNSGGVSVQSGTLELGAGGTGNGSFDVALNTILYFSGGTYTGTGGSAVAGAGRVRLAGGLNFSGSSVNVGILEQTGGSSTLNAPVTVAGGATLNGTGVFGGSFGAGSLTVSGTATFNGPVTAGPGNISGSATFNNATELGTMTLTGAGSFNGVARVSGLNLSGTSATLGGTNVVTVTNLTWTGGYMSGVGQTVVPPGGSLWIDGTAVKYLSQRVLSNQGTAVWTNTGGLYGYYGAVVNNSGTWDTRSDATFLYYGGGSYPPAPVFNNSGGFTKTGGTGSTVFSMTVFNNSGGVSVQSGTLELGAGGTGNGSFDVALNAILYFSGGTYTGTGGGAMTGAGRVRVAGGLNFSGSSVNIGILEQTGGSTTLNAPVTVAGAATLNGTGVFGGSFGAGSLAVGGTATFNGTASASLATVSGSATFNGSAGLGTVTLTGTGSFNGPGTLSTLNLSGANGTLGGTNVVTVTNLTWTGGSMTGVGQTVVPPGGSLWIDGTAVKYLNRRTLNNQGAAVWTNTGGLYGYYGAVVNNSGAWDTRSDATFLYYGGGSYPPVPVFNNSGSFTKTGGTGSTIFSMTVFNNSGMVSVQKGTLELAYGGVASGSFDLATNSILTFSGLNYVLGPGSAVTGGGRVRVNVGLSCNGAVFTPGILELASTATFNGPVDVDSVTLSGNGVFNGPVELGTVTLSGTFVFNGLATVRTMNLTGSATFNGPATLGGLTMSGTGVTLGGTNVVTVTNLTWTGGYMTGVGQTVVPPGGSLWLDGTAVKYLSQRVLSNQGTAVWTNTGGLYGYYGAVVNNSGTWDTRSDATFLYYGGGSYPPVPVFNNSGSFTKTGGGGSTVFSGAVFNNSGGVSVQSGTLELGAGGTGNGSFDVALNTILYFSGGTYTGTGGSAVTGAGRVRLAGGLNFSGSSVNIGILEQTGGSSTLNAPVTVAGGATLNGTGVFGGSFGAGSLTVSGTATFNGPVTAGPGNISGSATFNNATELGTMTLTGAGSFNGVARVSGLNLSGTSATLGGTNVVTVTNLTWTGGYMSGVGQTVVPPGGSLWIDGTAVKYLSQRVLSNQGTAVWTNTGGLYGYYGAVVNSSGTWDTRSDATFLYYGGGSYPPAPVFNNSGGFTKTGGTGSTVFSMTVFNNSGGVSVQSGTLELGAGGTGNGSFDVALNAILYFSGGTYTGTGGGAMTGAGRVRVAGGLNFSGSSVNIGILEQTGGSTTLNAPVTVAGAATVNGTGVFGGSFGADSLAVGGTATFNGTASASSATVSGSATFNGSAGLGTVTLTGTGSFNGPGTLSTLNLSGANGTLGGTNVVTVTNLTWTGGYMTGVGQTVVPPGGSLWIDGTAVKYLNRRVLSNQGAAVWTNTGGLYGYYGAVVNNSGAWDTRADATFLYYGGGSYPPAPVFNNSGSFTKTGGTGSTIFSGAAFNNSGSLDLVSGTLSFQSSQFTQKAGSTRLHGGVLASSPNPVQFDGGAVWGNGNINANVQNDAELDPGAPIGTITINGTCTHSGNLNLELGGLTPGTQFDRLSVSGAAGLGGNLNIRLSPGYRPSLGNSFTILTYASRSGNIRMNGLDLGAGVVLKPTWSPTNLVLVATNGPTNMLAVAIAPWESRQWQLRFTGQPGQAYCIQATTNFTTWLNLCTNAAPEGVIDYLDLEAANLPLRFYRAVTAP